VRSQRCSDNARRESRKRGAREKTKSTINCGKTKNQGDAAIRPTHTNTPPEGSWHLGGRRLDAVRGQRRAGAERVVRRIRRVDGRADGRRAGRRRRPRAHAIARLRRGRAAGRRRGGGAGGRRGRGGGGRLALALAAARRERVLALLVPFPALARSNGFRPQVSTSSCVIGHRSSEPKAKSLIARAAEKLGVQGTRFAGVPERWDEPPNPRQQLLSNPHSGPERSQAKIRRRTTTGAR
jgi:hypothetical protein